jgi:N-methylhydantoinase B
MRDTVDLVTLELIDNALRAIREEMDTVIWNAAMSPIIREQHDAFPLITDATGRMLVGQFGSYVTQLLDSFEEDIDDGDVILQNDPYLCDGAIQHTPDWLVLVPVDYEGSRIGYTSMFGHMMDVGGIVPGSMAANAKSIWDEGLRIPPIKIVRRGEVNRAALAVILRNTRTPDTNESDLFALIAACRTAAKRIGELCDRFGVDTYLAACEQLLLRARAAMAEIIRTFIPEEPVSFQDVVDDDGQGNGPFKLVMTLWREGDVAHLDWTGTDGQAPGPINALSHKGLLIMFFAIYLIMAFDPEILFNDGYADLFELTLPADSIVKPSFPAPLGLLNLTLARQFDVFQGVLAQCAPAYSAGAGYGSSPAMTFSGVDAEGQEFQLEEISFGGLPGRPAGDGLDGHSWWPLFTSIPTEYLESYYPITVERYRSLPDSGGAGRHRGGNGIEKVYRFDAPGFVTIQDDRWRSRPWGVLGGRSGSPSSKQLVRKSGDIEDLPSKCDLVPVAAGDRLVFITAGGGGLGDPEERLPEQVIEDVRRGLVTQEAAEQQYGLSRDGRDPADVPTGMRND